MRPFPPRWHTSFASCASLASFVVAAIALVIAVTLGTEIRAGAQESNNVAIDDPAGLADSELLDLLDTADVLDEWFATSPHSTQLTALRLVGNESYEQHRGEVITAADSLIAARVEAAQLRDLKWEQAERRSELVEMIISPFPSDEEIAKNIDATDETAIMIAQLEYRIARIGLSDDRARDSLLAAMSTLHAARESATSPIDELPVAVVDAYISAANNAPAECGVSWTLLAGIGRIESLHGTLNGSGVSSDGSTWPRIFGPLLDGGATERLLAEEAAAAEAAAAAEEEAKEVPWHDQTPAERFPDLFGPKEEPTPEPDEADVKTDSQDGTEDDTEEDNDTDEEEEPEEEGNGFAVIEDTDNGNLDGNPNWDRAVGPMQFIPGTWALFDTDGNRDGWADIHNFYDAAASAANYLCDLERRNGPDPWVTLRGYNDSSSYVADVIETSDRLAASHPLPIIDVSSPKN